MMRAVKKAKAKRSKKLQSAKRPASFRSYAQGLSPASPAAAFVAACRRQGQFPDASTWRDLRFYLNQTAAEHNVFVAARAAWRAYILARS